MDTTTLRWEAVPNNPCNIRAEEAAEIGVELLRIQEHYGRFSLDLLVQEAKRTKLRCYFTWDDTEAAQAYRVLQAEKLIGCVRVARGSGAAQPVEALVQVDRAQVKMANVRVRPELDPEDKRRETIEALLLRLLRIKPQLEQYTELVAVAAAIDEAAGRLSDAMEEAA